MPSWNADQYLQFADERTRPCRDLAARIDLDAIKNAMDLGCGPGNSTEVLAARWPKAELTGLDSSPEMIAAARETQPDRRWIVGDIAAWAEGVDRPYDLVFSNAALQWVADHAVLYPQLLEHVGPGGALAVQVPGNYDAPAHRLMRDLAESAAWRDRFPSEGVREWHVQDEAFYYDTLVPRTTQLDIWSTEYIHVMKTADAIVAWYRGTGLRPFLDALGCEADRNRFVQELTVLVRAAYPARPDGRVLFPFRRVFLIAYR